MIAFSIIVFSYLYMSYNTTDRSNYELIVSVRNADSYFVAGEYAILMFTLIIVDIMLLRSLKRFYPTFYVKEKGKVRSLL